jgi:hypothetical protein
MRDEFGQASWKEHDRADDAHGQELDGEPESEVGRMKISDRKRVQYTDKTCDTCCKDKRYEFVCGHNGENEHERVEHLGDRDHKRGKVHNEHVLMNMPVSP